jgi:hypothetical protein
VFDQGPPSSAALQALGFALFVYDDSGALRLANTAPEWLCRLWPAVGLPGAELPAGLSPFLENFLIDAKECWRLGSAQRTNSGPWVEADFQGTEIQLEATALNAGGRAVLLLEQLGEEFEASKSVLQKARETLIAYQRLSEPQLPEIAVSLDRLRERYPHYMRCGFLIMRFTDSKPYGRIVDTICQTAQRHNLNILRADAHEFHADLLSNVKTYLHGCSFGVAVYDRIRTDEPNTNVGFEAGYMMAMNKPVLLLKDQTLPQLQADLAGKLYKGFDPHDPEATIPPQFEKWLEDYGIILP